MTSAQTLGEGSFDGPLSHLEMRSTASLIAERLREAIILGDLAPGAQLREADLADSFGVSRGPLREAIQRLVQEGLLVSIRNRGVFVIRLESEDVTDIYAAREAIESAAAMLIVQQVSTDAIEVLRAAYADMTAAAERGDARGLSDADQHFHTVLVDQSLSPRLRRMASTVLTESRLCMTALEERYRMPAEALREHAAIIAAIADGDPEAVRQATHQHMETAIRLLTGV